MNSENPGIPKHIEFASHFDQQSKPHEKNGMVFGRSRKLTVGSGGEVGTRVSL